ncbi:hypothetical protein, partial [Novosphingobium aerophilum]|uniref:hypothetical protein n=1 Tax=Novosphingobium aerophilum TaxID=2839843 RepID=UPI001BE4550E
ANSTITMSPVATSDAAFRGGACPTPECTIAYTGNYTTSADASQVLLAILAKKPSLVKDLFANRHVYQPQPDRAWLPGGPHPDDMTPEARWAEILQILNTARTRLQAKIGGRGFS